MLGKGVHRVLGVAVIGVLLCVPSISAVPFLQVGYDAARTGNSLDPGPKHFDAALRMSGIAGNLVSDASPLIVGDVVYFATVSALNLDDQSMDGAYAVYGVNVATGERLYRALEAPKRLSGFGSDGRVLLLTVADELVALNLADLSTAWRLPLVAPGEDADPRVQRCKSPAVWRSKAFLACNFDPESVGEGQAGVAPRPPTAVYLFKLDLEARKVDWVWPLDVARSSAGHCLHTFGAALIGSRVIVSCSGLARQGTSIEAVSSTGETMIIVALRADDGAFLWDFVTPSLSLTQRPPSARDEVFTIGRPAVTGTEDHILVKADTFVVIDAVSGKAVDSYTTSTSSGEYSRGFDRALALNGSMAYVTEGTTLYAFRFTPRIEPVWDANVAGPWRVENLLIADGVVFGVNDGGRIFGFDESGRDVRVSSPQLTLGVPGNDFVIALGESVLVAMATHAPIDLLIVGRPATGIQPSVRTPGRYPPLNVPFTVDLTGTSSGHLSREVEAYVDWGDGTIDDWARLSLLSHTYATKGDFVARYEFRTDQGQWASEDVVFHAGQPAPLPPKGPTILERAVVAGDRDLTWGLMGLFVAFAGAIGAVARADHRRRRFIRELGNIDRAYEMTKERPAECERALSERRTHTRAMLIDGKISEAQFALLEKRIDQHAGTARLAVLDERFDFLPHGAVRTIQNMLADGRVTAWERENLARALERETTLTKTQRRQVSELVGEWFSRDAAAQG